MTEENTTEQVDKENREEQDGSFGFLSILWGTIVFLWKTFFTLALIGLVLGLLVFSVYVLELDEQVLQRFESEKRWALTGRVFARPLELFEGQSLYADNFEKELKLLHYRKVDSLDSTGQYTRKGNTFSVNTRGFQFAEDIEQQRAINLSISKGRIKKLAYVENEEPLALMRLEPVLIGNFYPSHNEDRVLVRLTDVSPLLISGLLAVEDRKFYEHVGVNPASIARAMMENFKAGHTVQGGSTLTQQLVKNYFLTNEKSWKRKGKEAIMAMLLEFHYSKNEILQAYLNEIYLGQDGQRAIHGFGLAAQFYFDRPIKELKADQIALLIGLAKGASYYNPRRYPERALQRRNLVLQLMYQGGVLSQEDFEIAKARPLGVSKVKSPTASPFPAYMELVKQHLKRDYRDEDLHSEGLYIFTAMDPIVQLTSETVLRNRVAKLERANRIRRGKLNGALLVSTVQNSEIQAVVGGRDPRYAGYNRAVDAKRQIGSLVKPAIYLAALDKPRKYTLSTRINDGPVTVKLSRKKYWKPGNYDHRNMGYVTLLKALSWSRNTPAVRVGVNMKVEKIVDMLHSLGVTSHIPAYPSILLGALEMAPIEVQQMYQTIASGGSYTPLKTIRSVMDARGKTLKRFPIEVKQVASPEAAYLLTYGMNQVTKEGTAKYLSKVLPSWKNSAGKTGTTNDKRDSWYAGFTGKHVVSVWVGRDDNKPTNLTGGSGALKVWADLIKILPTKPFKPRKPKGISWAKVDKSTGLRYNPECGSVITVPFKKGSVPKKTRYCEPPPPPVEEPVIEGLPPAAPATGGVPTRQGSHSSWVDELLQ